jgi:hypothetical protein
VTRRFLAPAAFAFLFLAACAATRSQTPSRETMTAAPGYLPQPGDGSKVRGRAFVDRAMLNGNRLAVVGNLPTPCHQLRLMIPNAPDAAGLLAVEAYSVVDGSQMCAQVLQPFNVDAALTSAQARARVTVNGAAVGPLDR